MVMDRDEMQRKIDAIRERMADAAGRAGRATSEIALVGVSKFQPLPALYTALDCGIALFGENRVQEREEKAAAWTRGPAEWHMIGHLQRNKARRALQLFDCIESVDNLDLAAALDRILSEGEAKRYPIFLEVNTSGEETKNGVAPEQLFPLIDSVLERCPRLDVVGLMTIGPLTEDEDAVRRAFASLRVLAEGARERFGLPLQELSMGMSGDYEAAILEGSTIIRIGTGIFGARH